MRWTGTKRNSEGCLKLRSGLKPFVDQSSWGPLYLPMPLPDCLCHVSFSRYSPLSLEVVEKPSKCKSFSPPIFSGYTTPTFLRQTVCAIYHPPSGKVWLRSVCWSPSAKPGNEVECRICGGWVKTHFQFEAFCRPKFMSFWDDVGDPL